MLFTYTVKFSYRTRDEHGDLVIRIKSVDVGARSHEHVEEALRDEGYEVVSILDIGFYD